MFVLKSTAYDYLFRIGKGFYTGFANDPVFQLEFLVNFPPEMNKLLTSPFNPKLSVSLGVL